ncbi:citrate carrier [Citrobacter freundii]|nr:citrate carrier [Citrobacter freundii]
MSLAKDKIWKLLAPLVVMGVMFLIPVPDGMPPQAWHYFAVFVAMIVGMILEPIPATAISFIAVTICVIGSNYLLFDASELADPAFKAGKQALKWGLAGFSSTTVWLVFGAFIFALGYEVTGLGRRIALFLVKFMGKRTLTLGYAIVIIDILLAPFTPSNTARTGGTVFPVIKNLPPLFKSFPNDPSARRIGGYLMWMDGNQYQPELLYVRDRRCAKRTGSGIRQQNCRYSNQLAAMVPQLPAGRYYFADRCSVVVIRSVQTRSHSQC